MSEFEKKVRETLANPKNQGEMNDADMDRMSNVWRIDPVDLNRFQKARTGDHLMVAFECDLCVFWKLFGREPTS